MAYPRFTGRSADAERGELARTRTRAAALRPASLGQNWRKESPPPPPSRSAHRGMIIRVPCLAASPRPHNHTRAQSPLTQQCRRRTSWEPGTVLDSGEQQRANQAQTPPLHSHIHTGPLRHPALPPPSFIRASWSHTEGPVAGGGREACELVPHIQGRPTLILQVISK